MDVSTSKDQSPRKSPLTEVYLPLLQGAKVAAACETANVKAFPTWVIGGRNIEGELQLPELQAELDKLTN